MHVYGYTCNSVVFTQLDRLELSGFGDFFFFCMTREEGTGLWYFFIMLVLASAADR